MIRYMRIVASVLGVLTGLAVGNSALAQKYGGTLRIYSPDSPATMSILEEATSFAVGPMMGVFNNLVLFDQSVKQAFQRLARPRTSRCAAAKVNLVAWAGSRYGDSVRQRC
jgi:hypothetical protein